jgi:hypothetical protein
MSGCWMIGAEDVSGCFGSSGRPARSAAKTMGDGMGGMESMSRVLEGQYRSVADAKLRPSLNTVC